MNQAASATRRPAGSTTTAGCCPMFNTPFFVNTFTPQAPLIPPPVASRHCFLGPQATQIPIPSTQPQQQNAVLPQPAGQQQQQPGVPSNGSSNHPQQPQAPQQQQPQRPQDHPNTYSTSPITAPALSLQHLLASRHSASNCMALAAALASASFPHFQQLQQAQQQQQQQQQHHQTPINQSTNTNNTNVASPPSVMNANTTNTATNQVPMLNFNSYNVAQSFLNMPAPTAPPATAHLNLSNNNNNNHHQQQSNSVTSTTSQPTVVQPTPHANTGNIQTVSQQNHQHRPLATNTTLNSAANQQHQPTNYRNNAPVVPTQPAVQAPPVQQLGQVRNVLSDEALNSLFNDQFQAILLNQLFANHRYAPPVTVPAPPQQQQAQANPTDRPPQQQQPLTGPAPVVMPPAQQAAAPIVPQPQQQAQEQVSGQQPAFQSQQQTAQPRLAQVPTVESYTSSGVSAPNGVFPPQQQHTSSVNHHQHQPSSESPQLQAQQPIQQQQAPPQQQQQQPQSIPQIPFYSFPQMEQALALLTNPQVANNIFSHVFNIYFQSGMRTEPHHTHHHHHPSHHFHHHLHGSHHHHHHHHGPNGQGNGQDVTMPLDSLAISESKPRGLNRAEIDSLTPYIHMNEKDSRTCVICLSKFELKSKIRPLPCNHAFHAKCVDKWLRANRTCPICRRDALKTYGAKIKRI